MLSPLPRIASDASSDKLPPYPNKRKIGAKWLIFGHESLEFVRHSLPWLELPVCRQTLPFVGF